MPQTKPCHTGGLATQNDGGLAAPNEWGLAAKDPTETI